MNTYIKQLTYLNIFLKQKKNFYKRQKFSAGLKQSGIGPRPKQD